MIDPSLRGTPGGNIDPGQDPAILPAHGSRRRKEAEFGHHLPLPARYPPRDLGGYASFRTKSLGSRRRKEADGPLRSASLPRRLHHAPAFLLPPPHVGGYNSGMPLEPKANLPRLERHHYQGHAVVFWTNTLEERARGWLTPTFHAAFRELMLHAAARYSVWCPAYCLMPDHLHLLWMGMRRQSDQLNAMKFLRLELEPVLGPGREWQHQAHDHVLREEERRRGAFATTCFYVLDNPARAGLAASRREWPFCGAVVPGYPRLHPLAERFWDQFWKLYTAARQAEPPFSPPLLPQPPSSPPIPPRGEAFCSR